MRSSRLLFCFAITLVAMALPTLAADSGKVTVTILDETGAPFPGVVVTLANTKNLAPSKALSTSAEGKAVFGVVQAGSGYMVTIEVAGYQKIEEANISVGINANLNLLYKFQQQKTEKIVFAANKPVASIDERARDFKAEFLQDLPILGRNYQSALTLAPGVNDANGDGNPNVHGARERDFKATLDGISNVDPLTGTFMSNINPDAIEEIEVVTTGADASYGRAVGGFANIITKQGSNDFEGVVKMIYRNSALDGNGASSLPAKFFKFDWYQPSVSLTGKIIRDKLFFAVNHEYHDVTSSTAEDYYRYFYREHGTIVGDSAKYYYSYDLGAWHIVVLNTILDMSAGSPQEQWLRADLAASTKTCTIAYMHYPRFSSGANHGSDSDVQPLWQALYDYGAEIAIAGHDHEYERFAPQTPSGQLDTQRGIRAFVVGTGGGGLYSFSTPLPNSEVRNSSTFGVLKLTLGNGTYSWQFVPIGGQTFTDSGSGTCH